MNTMKAQIWMIMMIIVPTIGHSMDFMKPVEKDTVIIELENGSKIIIYTRNKAELKKLQAYDVNKMIKDLNKSVQEGSVDFMEIQSEDGERYLIDSPKVVFGERQADGDTVVIDEDALDEIRIRVGGLELNVDPEIVDEYDDDPDGLSDVKKYSYVERERERTRHYFNFDIGTNNWMENGDLPSSTDAPYSVKPWGSWYVGMNWLNRTWVGGPLYIEWGGGVSWYNWKLEDNDVMIVKGDTQVEFQPVPDGVDGQKSKLSATYLNASFVPMFDFGRGSKRVKATSGNGFTFKSYRKTGFRIGAGMYAGYRLGSKAKLIYKEDGDMERSKDKDHFFLSNFRYGVRGQIGFRSFDMFILYDLNEVFTEGRGPNGARLNAFTIGITL